jgi:predicted dehydrogenase
MAPIRTAIIGLSASAKTSWAAGAHLPYLTSKTGQKKYEIVALLNSSEKAARAAIEAFKLPDSTKAYGDPESLAADPDIDLVVNCTRVDVHHGTILPSVKAGKSVYVEWPLAQDVKHAKELVDTARKSGSQTVVGIQGRLGPVNLKIREILESGRIGKVLSSEFLGYGGTNDRVLIPHTLSYFGERAVGGNVWTINYGHCQYHHLLTLRLRALT